MCMVLKSRCCSWTGSSLLAALGGLLKTTTPEIVRGAFTRVSVKDVKHWDRTSIPTTLHSKRLATDNEFKQKHATT